MAIILSLFLAGSLSFTAIYASECKEMHKHNYLNAKKKNEEVLWFATWCKPCMEKILNLTPEKFSKTTIVGTYDSNQNIEKAYQLFIQKIGSKPQEDHCFFDKNATLAEALQVDDFSDPKNH